MRRKLRGGDGTAISLNTAFVSGTKDYTASVANGVTSIALTPTVNESNASFEYFDASDAAITDTDASTDALDAPLAEGRTPSR